MSVALANLITHLARLLPVLFILLTINAYSGATQAATITVPVNVASTANIWSSGHATATSLTGGAGSLSVLIDIPAGHDGTFTISDVSGLIDYGPCCAPNDADGIAASPGGGASLDYRGIAGVTIARGRFLAGVFLDDSEPADPAPAKIVVSDIATTEFSPTLAQSFFIGDGLTGTGTGSIQIFNIPAGATRLYLGFHDAFNNLPGYYHDNSGSLDLDVNFTVVPLPASFWLLGSGLVALAGYLRRRA